MATSVLNLHSGGHLVSRQTLDQIRPPDGTATWKPVAHAKVFDTVAECLTGAGYVIKDEKHAVARDGHRYFATLDLATPLSDGVALAVGVRNSTDQSFPLSFCAGSRVFVCSNLAFKAELLVKRKHTRFGELRFSNAIAGAVQNLAAFKESESLRIDRLKSLELSDDQALAFIVRSMERNVIASTSIPKILHEWRNPSHDYGTGDKPTAWRLMNAYTTVLGPRAVKAPAEYAGQTIRLNAMWEPANGQAS